VKELNNAGGRAKFDINFTADLDDNEYVAMLGLKPIDFATGRLPVDLDPETKDGKEQKMTQGRKL